LLDDSLKLLQETGDPTRVSIGRLNLGDLARDAGEWPQAQSIYAETLAQCRAAGEKWGSALALYSLGLVAAEEGDAARALALFTESLSLYRTLNYRLGMVEALEAIAATARTPAEQRRAVRWLGAAAQVREQMRAPVLAAERPRDERTLARLCAAQSQPVFDALWAEGRILPLEEAVREALAPASRATSVTETSTPIALRVFSLGPAYVLAGEHKVTEWTYAKARELLYFLLTHPPQTKAQIGLALWPDASPVQLRNIFHRALHSLRTALGGADWVTFEDNAYTFNRARPIEFDAEVFSTRVKAAQRLGTTTPEQRQAALVQLATATRWYQGDFLNDLDVGEWALAQREELRRLNLEALLVLGRLQFAEAHYAQAAQAYERVLAFDSYLELAHRELMRCYARQGEAGQALRQYQTLSELLRAELGAQPAAETTFLYERLKRGDDV
jgi:DNA-binding SARP family transcriptional activator